MVFCPQDAVLRQQPAIHVQDQPRRSVLVLDRAVYYSIQFTIQQKSVKVSIISKAFLKYQKWKYPNKGLLMFTMIYYIITVHWCVGCILLL